MTIKKTLLSWAIIWLIFILGIITFAIFFTIKNEQIQEWYVYYQSKCNINELNDYILLIKNDQNKIINYYEKINYYLQFSDQYLLNHVQINTLNWLLKINPEITPLISFPIVCFIFCIFIFLFVIMTTTFIVFLIKQYKYKKYSWFYHDFINDDK